LKCITGDYLIKLVERMPRVCKAVLWSDDSKFLVKAWSTVTHGGGVKVWGCFADDTVCDLLQIQVTLNLHGYHSILQ
jgi:hypothetical protein